MKPSSTGGKARKKPAPPTYRSDFENKDYPVTLLITSYQTGSLAILLQTEVNGDPEVFGTITVNFADELLMPDQAYLDVNNIMDKKIVEMLHLVIEPVGVFFGNTSANSELEASPQKRNCVISFVLAAAKGKITSLDEAGCTCPGGAVGACFGDGFTRLNPNIHVMLSQGLGEKAPVEAPPMLKEGERFFCDAEMALKWRNSMPYSERAYPRIVFAPLSRWSEVGTPDLVFVFANADQISAIVTMQGFHNGNAVNTLAPFGAACHSIVYAAEQMDQEEPHAIMGLFDISQRSAVLKDYLSMTMPYKLWENMIKDLEISCLTTHSWRKIEERL